MAVRTKRVYEDPDPEDGTRVLVNRLWPHGVSKEEAHLDDWMEDIAPSDDLREWFDHDPDRWNEFRKRYHSKLDDRPDEVQKLLEHAQSETLRWSMPLPTKSTTTQSLSQTTSPSDWKVDDPLRLNWGLGLPHSHDPVYSLIDATRSRATTYAAVRKLGSSRVSKASATVSNCSAMVSSSSVFTRSLPQ